MSAFGEITEQTPPSRPNVPRARVTETCRRLSNPATSATLTCRKCRWRSVIRQLFGETRAKHHGPAERGTRELEALELRMKAMRRRIGNPKAPLSLEIPIRRAFCIATAVQWGTPSQRRFRVFYSRWSDVCETGQDTFLHCVAECRVLRSPA